MDVGVGARMAFNQNMSPGGLVKEWLYSRLGLGGTAGSMLVHRMDSCRSGLTDTNKLRPMEEDYCCMVSKSIMTFQGFTYAYDTAPNKSTSSSYYLPRSNG